MQGKGLTREPAASLILWAYSFLDQVRWVGSALVVRSDPGILTPTPPSELRPFFDPQPHLPFALSTFRLPSLTRIYSEWYVCVPSRWQVVQVLTSLSRTCFGQVLFPRPRRNSAEHLGNGWVELQGPICQERLRSICLALSKLARECFWHVRLDERKGSLSLPVTSCWAGTRPTRSLPSHRSLLLEHQTGGLRRLPPAPVDEHLRLQRKPSSTGPGRHGGLRCQVDLLTRLLDPTARSLSKSHCVLDLIWVNVYDEQAEQADAPLKLRQVWIYILNS